MSQEENLYKITHAHWSGMSHASSPDSRLISARLLGESFSSDQSTTGVIGCKRNGLVKHECTS